MSARPFVSWKRIPPKSPEEASAAALLRSLGPTPPLAPEVVERIAHRAHLTVRSQRARVLLRRRARFAYEARVASIAAAIAVGGIVAALAWLVIELAGR